MTDSEKINRRELIIRTTKAAASIIAAGTVSYLLYDRKGPAPSTLPKQLVTFPDYSVPSITGKTISIIKGGDRKKSLALAIKALGGITRFIKPGDTVAIKPNIAFASSPMLGATSHPDLIAELVRLCLEEAKAKHVFITDNPINDAASSFLLTGIGKAAEKAGAEIILPKPHLFKNATLDNAKLIVNWPVYFEPFAKADKLIGVAPLKDHHRSKASMTMKNWYGLLGGRRNIFHQDINTVIAELSIMIKPTLVILDGTETMITNGPTGGSLSDLKKTDTIIASCDQVAADAFGCSLLGLTVADLPYLAKAQAAAVGTADYMSLKPIIENAG